MEIDDMGWREILNFNPKDFSDLSDKRYLKPDFNHLNHFNPMGGDIENADLTDSQKAAFDERVEMIVGPKWRFSNEFARKTALELVTGKYRTPDAEESAHLLRTQGYVLIYSCYLRKPVYLIRNQRVRVPNPNIQKFNESEIKAL